MVTSNMNLPSVKRVVPIADRLLPTNGHSAIPATWGCHLFMCAGTLLRAHCGVTNSAHLVCISKHIIMLHCYTTINKYRKQYYYFKHTSLADCCCRQTDTALCRLFKVAGLRCMCWYNSIKNENTLHPAVRSTILSKFILASCV